MSRPCTDRTITISPSLLQGPGARAARGLRDRSARGRRGALDQGLARRLTATIYATAWGDGRDGGRRTDMTVYTVHEPPAAQGRRRAESDERRHRRLRLRQPALRRQGVRARGARAAAHGSRSSSPRSRRGARADRIVLPGVGAFADCRAGSTPCPAWSRRWTRRCARKGRPFLGICVGMQLMAERGLEHGDAKGSAGSPARSTLIAPSDPSLKIPHMGWNTLDVARPHPLLDGIPTGRRPARLFRALLSPRARDPTMSPPPTMAGRSPRSSRATTWPARSSIPRRASARPLR
jgi:hypothetical protein